MKEENDMGLWIYLSGVIVTMMLCFWFIYKDWSHGMDTKLSDILIYVVTSFASWVAIIFIVVSLLWDKYSQIVVIKGKKH